MCAGSVSCRWAETVHLVLFTGDRHRLAVVRYVSVVVYWVDVYAKPIVSSIANDSQRVLMLVLWVEKWWILVLMQSVMYCCDQTCGKYFYMKVLLCFNIQAVGLWNYCMQNSCVCLCYRKCSLSINTLPFYCEVRSCVPKLKGRKQNTLSSHRFS